MAIGKEKDKNIMPTKDKIKEKENNENLNEKLKEKKKEKSKEKTNKIIPDKDLSDSENDSLILYVNNNIENNLYQDSALNESSCSMLSTNHFRPLTAYEKSPSTVSTISKSLKSVTLSSKLYSNYINYYSIITQDHAFKTPKVSKYPIFFKSSLILFILSIKFLFSVLDIFFCLS